MTQWHVQNHIFNCSLSANLTALFCTLAEIIFHEKDSFAMLFRICILHLFPGYYYTPAGGDQNERRKFYFRKTNPGSFG